MRMTREDCLEAEAVAGICKGFTAVSEASRNLLCLLHLSWDTEIPRICADGVNPKKEI